MFLSHSGSVEVLVPAFLRLVIFSHLESESKQKASRDFRKCNGASAVLTGVITVAALQGTTRRMSSNVTSEVL